MSKPKAARNQRIVELYDNPTKKLSFAAIARIFQLSEPRVRLIYQREKQRKEQHV